MDILLLNFVGGRHTRTGRWMVYSWFRSREIRTRGGEKARKRNESGTRMARVDGREITSRRKRRLGLTRRRRAGKESEMEGKGIWKTRSGGTGRGERRGLGEGIEGRGDKGRVVVENEEGVRDKGKGI